MKKAFDFKAPYYKFISLILDNPTIFLNKYGLIIYEIMVNGGSCESVKNMAKYLNITKESASILCNKLCNEGYITLVKEGRRKILKITEK